MCLPRDEAQVQRMRDKVSWMLVLTETAMGVTRILLPVDVVINDSGELSETSQNATKP